MKDIKPKVSVIMPVFNDFKYLRKAINSILCQTYSNFELIIVNDGSNIKVKKIINEYKKYKKIKVIINKKNLGLATSLNKGIRICKGEYIARMDADDYSFKKRLSTQVEFLNQKKNISILGSDAIIERNIQNKFKKNYITNLPSCNRDIKYNLLFKNPIMHSSVMFRKYFIKKIRGYDSNYLRCQDYELWLRARKNFEFFNLKKVLIKYRSKSNYDFISLYYFLCAIFKHNILSRNFFLGIFGVLQNLFIFFLKKYNLYK